MDGITDSIIAAVGVGKGPWGVDVNPETNRIYSADYDAGTVTVINGDSNSVIDTVTVGIHPRGIAVNRTTNRIYVTNEGSNTISVIDGSADSLLSTITVGEIPVCVCVSPSKNRIYVGCFGQGTIWVLQDQAVEIHKPKITKQSPFSMTITPNPCRNSTVIRFTTPAEISREDIGLTIYDMQGRVVKTIRLFSSQRASRIYVWDCTDNCGKKLAGNVYFLAGETGNHRMAKKIFLMK